MASFAGHWFLLWNEKPQKAQSFDRNVKFNAYLTLV